MQLCCTTQVDFFFFHGKLVFSVAVSTTDRQASWLAAFLQAEDRPMFKGLKSDSTARNHVCQGRPAGRLQSGGGFWIAAEAARWLSWMGGAARNEAKES